MGVVPEGGEQFAALARALDKAAEKTLAKELHEGFANPLRELIPRLQEAQSRVMPGRGGMRARARRVTKYGTRRVLSSTKPGMRLQARAPSRISRQDAGILRHPVFADQAESREDWKWVNQRIPAGWFTTTVGRSAGEIRAAQEKALENVVRQIEVDMARAT